MSKKKVETFIDEVKKVVVTKIKAQDIIYDDFFFTETTHTGKAKCSPEDTFDVELGKKLSLARAWLKYDNFRLKTMDERKKALEEELNEVREEEAKLLKVIERTEAKIEELVDSTEE